MKFNFFEKFQEGAKKNFLVNKMQNFIKLDYNNKIASYCIKFDKLLCKEELEKSEQVNKIRKHKYEKTSKLQNEGSQGNLLKKNLKLVIE